MPDCRLPGRSQMKSTKPETNHSPRQVTSERLRAHCSQERRRSRDTAPVSPSLLEPAGVLFCLWSQLRPHATLRDELLSGARGGSISLPARPPRAAARPLWSSGYRWLGHQPLRQEQRGYKASFPPRAQSREPRWLVPCASPQRHFQPGPREMHLSSCQELLVPRCSWEKKRAGDVWPSKQSLMARIAVYRITRTKSWEGEKLFKLNIVLAQQVDVNEQQV